MGRAFVLTLCLCSTLTASAAAPPTTMPVEQVEVRRQARIVFDLSRMDFGAVVNFPESPWVVARVLTYGTRTEKTDWTVGLDGAPFWPQDSPTRYFIEGEVRVLDVLTQAPEEPLHGFEAELRECNEIEPEVVGWLGSPFTRAGGTVIMRVNDYFPGFNRFRPAIMIPPDWREFAAPALDYYKRNRPLFAAADAGRNRGTLVKLLSDGNPFLAIGAFRTLAAGGAASAEQLAGNLPADVFTQGAEAALLMREGTPDRREAGKAALAAKVDGAKAFDDVRGIAAAYLVDGLCESDRNLIGPKDVELREKLVKKMAASPHPTETDRYVELVLRHSGRGVADTRPAR